MLANLVVDSLRPERQAEEDAAAPPADLHDWGAPLRRCPTPIREGGSRRKAQAPVVRSYDRALADSLEAAKEVLDELAEQHGPVGVGLLRVVEQRLAANRWRLGQDVIRRDGEE